MNPTEDTTQAPTLWERFSARIYDPFFWLGEHVGMARRRADLLSRARGHVLEIGAGTGLNVPHYPEGIERLVLAEPVDAMARHLQRRVQRAGLSTEVIEASAESLPFADASFDTVVSTLVLCTVEDQEKAIAEIRRVLKPGGRLLFVEHLLSESPRLARWQERLNPAWRSFANGCNCNRRTIQALEYGGLVLNDRQDARWRGMPFVLRPIAFGSAGRG